MQWLAKQPQTRLAVEIDWGWGVTATRRVAPPLTRGRVGWPRGAGSPPRGPRNPVQQTNAYRIRLLGAAAFESPLGSTSPNPLPQTI